jgi:hypothetical protein
MGCRAIGRWKMFDPSTRKQYTLHTAINTKYLLMLRKQV